VAFGVRASAHHRSAGELVKQLSEQVPALVREELKLARLEMTHQRFKSRRKR
jgi:hypothetical protein